MTEFTKDKLKIAVFESKLNVMNGIIERTLRDVLYKNDDENPSIIVREAIDDLKGLIKLVEIDLENIENCKTTVTEWWSKD